MDFDAQSGKPIWARRVPMNLIRRLYEAEARGILDDELIERVGVGIFRRCESILIASDAAIGRVHCPRCDQFIARAADEHDQVVACERCGWSVRWGDYLATYQHRDLWGGGFSDAIREFMSGWERAVSARDKIRLIDRIIHVWHWMFSAEHSATRPAAPTFIEGSRRQVIAFLDSLAAR